jgi:hypothetical protein
MKIGMRTINKHFEGVVVVYHTQKTNITIEETVKEKISNTELDIHSFKKFHHLSKLSRLSYTIISFTVNNIAKHAAFS